MAKMTFLKRLVREDFKKDDQPLIDKVAAILNPALESLSSAFNKDISFTDNINCQVKEITIELNSDGTPKIDTSFKTELRGLSKGVIVLRAENLTANFVYPSASPFISFTENNGQIEIDHVAGLPSGYKWRLRVISVG